MNRRAGFLFGVIAVAAAFASGAAAREYVVRPGDTLSVIAERELGAASRWREIAEANGIRDPRRLFAGMRLRLPDEGGTADEAVRAARAFLDRARAALSARAEASALSFAEDELLAAEAALRAGWADEARARAERARAEAERVLARAGVGLPQEVRIRPLRGPVRYRENADAPWRDLSAEVVLAPGAEVMTSNLGEAEVRTGGIAVRLSPSSILGVPESRLAGGRHEAVLRLGVGEAVLRAEGAAVSARIRAGAATLSAEGPSEATARALSDGRYRFALAAGSGEVVSGLRRAALSEGDVAEGSPGGPIEVSRAGAAASGVRLVAPPEGSEVFGDRVRFAWQGPEGAASYRFSLAHESGRTIERELPSPEATVTNLAPGAYLWTVRAIGPDGRPTSGEGRGRFSVTAAARAIEVTGIEGKDGRLVVRGKAWPGAVVSAADDPDRTAAADGEGAFVLELSAPAAPAVSVQGLVARDPGGTAPAARALAAAAVLDAPVTGARELPIRLRTGEEGTVRFLGGTVPAAWRLLSGANAARFVWEGPGGARWGDATVTVLADHDPPEIRWVRTAPEAARPGDEVVVRFSAEDGPAGSAAGLSETARVVVEGPGGFAATEEVEATDGVFEARFVLPGRMPRGILLVREIAVSDRAGNERVLSAEGLAREVDDPRAKRAEVLRNALAFGLGVLVGAAL